VSQIRKHTHAAGRIILGAESRERLVEWYVRDTGIGIPAHNGTTRVVSRPGEGSTFSFTIPVDESALSAAQLNPEFTAS
jgi:signal transduction histidine kinase